MEICLLNRIDTIFQNKFQNDELFFQQYLENQKIQNQHKDDYIQLASILLLLATTSLFVIINDSQGTKMNNRQKQNTTPLKIRGGISSEQMQSTLDKKFIEINRQMNEKIYAFPAHIENASMHTFANAFGFNQRADSKGISVPVCPCCEMPINTLPIFIDHPTTPGFNDANFNMNEYRLTSSISMFFTFIKMITCYLIMRLILTDTFNLLSSSLAGSYCKQNRPYCGSLLIDEMSSYNKIGQKGLIFALDILNMVTVIVSMIFFNVYRKYQYRIAKQIDKSQHTQDDYTIFCSHIPILFDINFNSANMVFDYQKKLKSFFDQKLDNWMLKMRDTKEQSLQQVEKQFLQTTKGLNTARINKVTSVTLCFDLSEMQILKQMRQNIMEQYKQEKQNAKKSKDAYLSIQEVNQNSILLKQKEMKLINQEEIKLSQKFAMDNSLAFNLTHFVGRAFVSFEYQHFRNYILREYQQNNSFLECGKGYAMEVSLASSPSDINWPNMKLPGETRIKYIIISYVVLLMTLIFAFAAILKASQIKTAIGTQKVPNEDTTTMVLTVLITIITLIINAGLGMLVKHLTDFQQHQTRSKHLVSLVVKTVITQFINTAIIYYISNLLTNTHYLSDQGLVLQISSLFLSSAIIQIGMNLLNPSALIKFVLNYFKYKKLSQVQMFQIELNQQIELAEFNLADRYAYYILQIYTCAFYSYLTPLAVFCLIPTIIVQYWVDKFNLFKRSSYKYEMDFVLSRAILKIFECSLLIFAVGNLLFSIVIHDEAPINDINIVAVAISFAYCLFNIFAPRYLQKKLFGQEEQIQKMTYTACLREKKFKQRYWTSNPATMYVKEIDLNTGQEVGIQQQIKFVDITSFNQAKKMRDQELKKEQIMQFDDDIIIKEENQEDNPKKQGDKELNQEKGKTKNQQ